MFKYIIGLTVVIYPILNLVKKQKVLRYGVHIFSIVFGAMLIIGLFNFLQQQ